MDTDTLTEALLEQAEAIIRVSPSQRSPPASKSCAEMCCPTSEVMP